MTSGLPGGVRTYRVSHVLRLTSTADRFERPTGFSLGEWWTAHLDDFDRRRLSRVAVLRVSPDLVQRLPDLSDPVLREAVLGVTPGADGWTTVELPVEHDDMAARRLLPNAGDVEVVSPQSLRQELSRRARALLRLHDGASAQDELSISAEP